LNSAAKAYLERYLLSLPVDARSKYQTYDAYHFCDDEENANLCAQLVLQGDKRASAGLLWGYEAEDEPLPSVRDLAVITDWDDVPQCIIEITSVEICPFNEVSEAFACEEGEGDESLEFWRRVHWEFFSQECQEIGKTPDEGMPVVLERFKVVFRGA